MKETQVRNIKHKSVDEILGRLSESGLSIKDAAGDDEEELPFGDATMPPNAAGEDIISGSQDEDDDETVVGRFENIEIHGKDDKAQIIIEFCGLEFDESSETVTISICANSWSEDAYLILIKDLMVNDQQYKSIDLIHDKI